jgi:hypothetical protein
LCSFSLLKRIVPSTSIVCTGRRTKMWMPEWLWGKFFEGNFKLKKPWHIGKKKHLLPTFTPRNNSNNILQIWIGHFCPIRPNPQLPHYLLYFMGNTYTIHRRNLFSQLGNLPLFPPSIIIASSSPGALWRPFLSYPLIFLTILASGYSTIFIHKNVANGHNKLWIKVKKNIK